MCVAIGLKARLGVVDGTAVAALGHTWRFVDPILIGDTIHLRMRVTDKRLTRDGERGIVTLRLDVLNQRDELV